MVAVVKHRNKRKSQVTKKSTRTVLEDLFATQIKDHKLPECKREFRFYPERRWRVDFAWPDYKLLVEIQGATYSFGRHTQGIGYANDREKSNTAQEHGWLLLEYDSTHVKQGKAIEQVERIIRRENNVDNRRSDTSNAGSSPSTKRRNPTRKKGDIRSTQNMEG